MFDLGTMVLRLVSDAKGVEEIEERVAKLVFELGRVILEAVYTYLDWRLMKKRKKGLRNIGMRERNVLTRFGVARVKRRYYRDKEGENRFLLDEAMGWEAGRLALTCTMETEALEMAPETSFRRAGKHLSFFLAVRTHHV